MSSAALNQLYKKCYSGFSKQNKRLQLDKQKLWKKKVSLLKTKYGKYSRTTSCKASSNTNIYKDKSSNAIFIYNK